ncbi:hypothetical protein CBS101457_003139 [Exobasidium rhododendri]|nr:hypothetical protein CBS101457_003139 [Exobasidium rhododendri]
MSPSGSLLSNLSLALLTLLFVTSSDAFPSFRSGQSSPSPFLQRRSISDPLDAAQRRAQKYRISTEEGARKRDATTITPDAAHPYQAPSSTDQRGPCPGLNTLANHGYLPRTGIVHWQDIIEGTKDGFNMANDLGTFLAIYGVLSEGDVSTGMLSIGGDLPSTLVGGRKGLQTHGAFEGDTSLARMDQYPNGRNWQFDQGTYDGFKAANTQYGGGNATLNSLTQYRYQRFMESKANNPQFAFIPPRYLFAPAEAGLVLQMFANRNNGGQDYNVAPDVLDSFFVNETYPPNFVQKQQPYTLPSIISDAIQILLPRFVPPGVNAGANNYVPLSPSLNASDLLTPSAYGCALYESMVAFLPSSLLSLPTVLATTVTDLANQLHAPFLDAFQCPAAEL